MTFVRFLRSVGTNIKGARLRSGYRQIDVNSCGLSYRHYQNIEAGKVNVTLETLYKLSKLYCVRVTDLVKEDAATRNNPPQE